ncbi:MAG: hypothetical protein R3E45_13740 [Rhodocyclaceae bacterium]
MTIDLRSLSTNRPPLVVVGFQCIAFGTRHQGFEGGCHGRRFGRICAGHHEFTRARVDAVGVQSPLRRLHEATALHGVAPDLERAALDLALFLVVGVALLVLERFGVDQQLTVADDEAGVVNVAGGERDGDVAFELAAGQLDQLPLPSGREVNDRGERPALIDVPQRRGAELGLLGGGERTADGDAVLDGEGSAVGGEDGVGLPTSAQSPLVVVGPHCLFGAGP